LTAAEPVFMRLYGLLHPQPIP